MRRSEIVVRPRLTGYAVLVAQDHYWPQALGPDGQWYPMYTEDAAGHIHLCRYLSRKEAETDCRTHAARTGE